MDPKLLAIPHINGDFSKINIDPKHKARLMSKYAATNESALRGTA
jgi:hypothetical protein